MHLFIFNFQLSHLFPQLGCHQFGCCVSRSGISGALPAGKKWLNNRYARAAHGVLMLHPQQVGATGANASIPVAPPQPIGRRAIAGSAAKGSKAARALGLFMFIFFGCAASNSAVYAAMRGMWLRSAHAVRIIGGKLHVLRPYGRILRFGSRVELGGSDRFVLRADLFTPASFAVKPMAY